MSIATSPSQPKHARSSQHGMPADARDIVQRRGYLPALHEICDVVGLTRPSAVSHKFSALQGKGCLRRGVGVSSTVEGRLPGYPALHLQAEDLAGAVELLPSDAAHVLVPVVGHIPAGELHPAESTFEDAFLLPKQLVGEGALFMLKVDGDSMIEAAIADGDWVVVRQQDKAENGEIVAAMIDGEVTLKTLQRANGQLWLMPRNPDYEPILGEKVAILGKVVGVVRQA